MNTLLEAKAAPEVGVRPADVRGLGVFGVSIVLLASAGVFAGVALGPMIQRWRHPSVPTAAELVAILEHAVVDVRLGHAAGLVEQLRTLAADTTEPITKSRILGLLAEAALQAGRLSDAATADAQREELGVEPKAFVSIRLRRIALAVALDQLSIAEELAKPLLGGTDSRVADEARLRLVASMKESELRSWVTSRNPAHAEEARRAGLAAIRLLGDFQEAERLLSSLEVGGQRDPSLLHALIEVYGRLDRPRDVARLTGVLAAQLQVEGERSRVVLAHAEALARGGDTDAALAAIEPLRHSRDFSVRQTGHRARYRVLQRTGRLDAEVASLRDPADRAFVALEVQRNYAEAVRLYETASSALPDSAELFEGLREAQRRRDLSERRTLYEQVMLKDPGDGATREKLLSVLVGLGEVEAVKQWVVEALKGREGSSAALVEIALALGRAGLDRDSESYLGKAYALASDAAQKQQILFALGDLYAGARQEVDARRLYRNLVVDGANQEIRERALARLSTLLH